MLSPSKGSLILESLGCFDHQVSGVFLVLFMLPLFILFARSSSCVLSMRSLEYLFFQSVMTSNYQSKNLLIYHVLFKISYSCLFGTLKIIKGVLGCKGALWKPKGLRREGFIALLWTYSLKEKRSQGRAHVASLKDEGEGFRIPKCVMHSRERGRVQGTLLKVEALCLWGVLKRSQEGHKAHSRTLKVEASCIQDD